MAIDLRFDERWILRWSEWLDRRFGLQISPEERVAMRSAQSPFRNS